MKIDDFFNELIDENEELKNSIELIDLKYKVIQALYSFRKANSLSQKDFAEKIGVKQQAISRFEKGEIDPRLSFIEKVLHGINSEAIIDNKTYIRINKTLEFKSKITKIEPSKYKLALSQKIDEIVSKLGFLKRLDKGYKTQFEYRNLYLEKSRVNYELDRQSDLGDAMVQLSRAEYELEKNSYEFVITYEILNLIVGETI